ncbi:FliO/MopB family protein [Aquipuribacter sp. MA13-6]|uniref:FliO/MopB family protein n=1 Tax=unclassified Aquipuribacter TaxID=2635084 RepID=UPI003EEA1DD7
MDTAELLVRSIGGLVAVLGTVWVLVRVVKARQGATGTVPVARLRVVARASVGRRASVVSVDAGDRVLVVGVTDDGVRLLAEQPALPTPEPVVERIDLDPAPLGAAPVDPAVLVPGPRSGTSGSLVDPAVWRQVVGTVREWTVRR